MKSRHFGLVELHWVAIPGYPPLAGDGDGFDPIGSHRSAAATRPTVVSSPVSGRGGPVRLTILLLEGSRLLA